jgi:hypothetical protein
MGPICHPPAFPLDILPRCDRCRGAHHGDEITVTADFDAQHTETGLLAMERDAFDGTHQVFRGLRRDGGRGEGIHRSSRVYGGMSTAWRMDKRKLARSATARMYAEQGYYTPEQ